MRKGKSSGVGRVSVGGGRETEAKLHPKLGSAPSTHTYGGGRQRGEGGKGCKVEDTVEN